MPSQVQTKQVVLRSWATGFPTEENFEVVSETLDVNLSPGDVLVQVLYLSVDPYMRGRMVNKPSYFPSFTKDKPLTGTGIGRVTESANEEYPKGSIVGGFFEWAEYTIAHGGQGLSGLWPVDTSHGFPLSWYLGTLGMPGMTAYHGLLEIGEPKEGETVYVSAASGAVGQVVGQLAKIRGCRVVGSAGSDDKIKMLEDKFKYDAAFNYKTTEDWSGKLKELCPDGIDIYFENVGGKMLEAALDNANKFARIPLCGMVSQYNREQPEGVHNMMTCVGKQIKLQGFIIGTHMERLRPQFLADMTKWVKEGNINVVEDVTEGFENLPKAFIGMLKGENRGKAVVKVAE